jgi:hypothetical protein
MTLSAQPQQTKPIEDYDELTLINLLYVRWVTNSLTPQDDLLLIKYQDRLDYIKAHAEYMALLRMDNLNFKLDQMNLNSSKEHKGN